MVFLKIIGFIVILFLTGCDSLTNKKDYNYLLMEVELIQPSIYFNMDTKSPQMFAEVFNKWHG